MRTPELDAAACKEIKCGELSEDGNPLWCYLYGCPAVAAAGKCPKAAGKQNMEEGAECEAKQ